MSRVYKTVITACDRFVPGGLRPLWEHEAGPKTIFFWAPAFKWVWNDHKCRVRAKLVSINASQQATGGGPSNASVLSPLEEKVANIIGRDVGPLPNVRQDQFAASHGLVMAGLGDLKRPVEKLSIPQSVSLAATGLIWSRYSLVIIPKNYSLFAVNVFVACTSLYQISRAVRHQQATSQK